MVHHNTKERRRNKTTEEEQVVVLMPRPERLPSKPLHNFILPSDLRWGNQRQLRCMNLNSNDHDDYDYQQIPAAVYRRSSFGVQFSSKKASDHSSRRRKEREIFVDDPPIVSSGSRRRSHFMKVGFDYKVVTPSAPPHKFRSSESDDDDEGNEIAAVREKLMIDIRTAADKMKGAILKDDMETVEQFCNNSSSPEPPAEAPASLAADLDGIVRPWTLRTRKAASKSPAANGHVIDFAGEANGATGRTGKGLESDVMKTSTNNKNPKRVIGVPAVAETPIIDKLSVALTKSEIEEDFLALTRRKPHRRPRKRPRYVQKQLDTLFPALWMTKVTTDKYKVDETQ